MADQIVKGVGEQLGELGKQIVKDVGSIPAKLTGFDTLGTAGVDETSGASVGGKLPQQPTKTSQINKRHLVQKVAQIKQKDEIEKQKQLAQARNLLKKFTQPPPKENMTLAQKQEMEELERQKMKLEEEKKKAAQILPKIVGRRPRGDLFGIKSKQFGAEVSKNIKSG